MKLPYRECVVAVIKNEQNLYLAGERSGQSGAWQFPQGGIDPGESEECTLLRELKEELGCSDVEILTKGSFTVQYDFPQNIDAPITRKYSGQRQRWFLVKFSENGQPDLSNSDHEFQDISWMSLDMILSKIISWKKDAYMKGLKSIGLLSET